MALDRETATRYDRNVVVGNRYQQTYGSLKFEFELESFNLNSHANKYNLY